jgi:alpha-glucosidase
MNLKTRLFLFALLIGSICLGQDELHVPLLPGEKIWSGSVKQGDRMPFQIGHSFDFYANNEYNQLQPLLLGNKGLWVWSEEPFAFEIQVDRIVLSKGQGEIKFGRAGKTLREARNFAAKAFFPASGKMPDEMLFSCPQYNTWIELTYNQNQNDVLAYAEAIISNGFEPGVLMVDDTWQEDYGKWDFHPGRFPDPKGMIDHLHKMGFKVMLWICPFVSPDQTMIVQSLMKDKAFLLQQKPNEWKWEDAKDPATIKWWNGYSALLDFTNPAAVDWFESQLTRLVNDYKIDGFKFDAGDMEFYPKDALSKVPVSPNRHCELFMQFGLKYPLNEYRAGWKMGGQPLAQRLHDKDHSWSDLQKLIPHMLTEGLIGYTFSCPDMIGGGNWVSFLDNSVFDPELVVRSAQIHAFMPMMQFSAAPWRVLDQQYLEAVKKALEIRKKLMPLVLTLVKESAESGAPIVRSMEYVFPLAGYEEIKDQFMVGDQLLVAPSLQKGITERQVVLPAGTWIDENGKKFKGGKTYTIPVPLERIPYFILKDSDTPRK